MLFCVAFVVACDDASVFADRAHERSSDLLKRSCSVMVITVHITVYTTLGTIKRSPRNLADSRCHCNYIVIYESLFLAPTVERDDYSKTLQTRAQLAEASLMGSISSTNSIYQFGSPSKHFLR